MVMVQRESKFQSEHTSFDLKTFNSGKKKQGQLIRK